jgi:hypothetical protein
MHVPVKKFSTTRLDFLANDLLQGSHLHALFITSVHTKIAEQVIRLRKQFAIFIKLVCFVVSVKLSYDSPDYICMKMIFYK